MFFILTYLYEKNLDYKVRSLEVKALQDQFMMAVFLAPLSLATANILPNISNWLRYRETKNDCEKWLSEKLGPPVFSKI
ncbi:MAG: hypothetical protein H0W64_11085 [Gammaproteobacteria bacterium]|nr:hypothetical protein [Gammaproteobacteria bacterium]